MVAESVLVLHDASEMVMQIVCEHHDLASPSRFMDFWPTVEKAQLAPAPSREQMHKLNELRKGFKHRGTIPNPRVVRSLDPEVRAFCSAVCSIYLNIRFDELSLADLIQNESARASIKASETLFLQHKVDKALVEIENAFHAVWTQAEKCGSLFVHQIPVGNSRLANGIAALNQDLVKALNLVLLGVDLQTYSMYCRLVPSVSRTLSGNAQVVWWHDAHATPEQFERLVGFVTDLALSLEQLSLQSAE